MRWIAGTILAACMAYAPYTYYRYVLEHGKRFRPIDEGRIFRSGCLTADGFREVIKKHKIKTVITFWDENPDPNLPTSRFDSATTKESELCASLGVNYRFIFVKLNENNEPFKGTPPAVAEFLSIMDKEESFPVLVHCKAGLHRTGVMTAIYRMEYDGWSRAEALRELRAHGFGYWTANRSNPYIEQYVMPYQPRALAGKQRTVEGQPASRTREIP
jgi:protein tyrosine phosphatase (PTP) superfamily phosphohydrolase (DUF442 family)